MGLGETCEWRKGEHAKKRGSIFEARLKGAPKLPTARALTLSFTPVQFLPKVAAGGSEETLLLLSNAGVIHYICCAQSGAGFTD